MIVPREAERAARAPTCTFPRWRADQKPWCWAGLISSDPRAAAGDECSSVLFCVSGKLKVELIQVEYCSKEMPLPSMACRAQNVTQLMNKSTCLCAGWNGISSALPWTNASAENSYLRSPAVQVTDGFLPRVDFPFIAPPVRAAVCTEGCPGLGDSIHVQQYTGKGTDTQEHAPGDLWMATTVMGIVSCWRVTHIDRTTKRRTWLGWDWGRHKL